jgi:uncharacterized membrane protein
MAVTMWRNCVHHVVLAGARLFFWAARHLAEKRQEAGQEEDGMNDGDDAIRLLAQRLLDMGVEDMPVRERRVLEKMAKRLAISQNVNKEFDRQRTIGERLADKVAAIGGSWSFISGFGALIATWMLINAALLSRSDAFDPYPFIFLNLILSLLAAVQAPVIMMSQNRQAAKDRLAAAHDYEVNLKAEIEIAALHEKLDRIRTQELATIMERIEANRKPD